MVSRETCVVVTVAVDGAEVTSALPGVRPDALAELRIEPVSKSAAVAV